MDEGKMYRIFYDDGERVRDKTLEYRKKVDDFYVFWNPSSKTEESISIRRIIRIERVK